MTTRSVAKVSLAAILVATDLFLFLSTSLLLLGTTGDLLGFLSPLWWLFLCVVCVDAAYVLVIVLIGKEVLDERRTLFDTGNLLICSAQGLGVAAIGFVLAVALAIAVLVVAQLATIPR
jgi:hypothetical protein